METIISIKDNDEGFTIKTDKQEIVLYIDTRPDCCEIFGYFLSEDDISSFIGSNLISVEVVDTELKNYEVTTDKCYSGNTMFVNLNTSAGVLQFVAYNDHNGYYGHEASVSCSQLDYSVYL